MIIPKTNALREMEYKAAASRADSIFGIHLDNGVLSAQNSMLMIMCFGTAAISEQ